MPNRYYGWDHVKDTTLFQAHSQDLSARLPDIFTRQDARDLAGEMMVIDRLAKRFLYFLEQFELR